MAQLRHRPRFRRTIFALSTAYCVVHRTPFASCVVLLQVNRDSDDEDEDDESDDESGDESKDESDDDKSDDDKSDDDKSDDNDDDDGSDDHGPVYYGTPGASGLKKQVALRISVLICSQLHRHQFGD